VGTTAWACVVPVDTGREAGEDGVARQQRKRDDGV
jgi:hypothetical protein